VNKYSYNADELVELCESTEEAYNSLDTRRGLKYRKREASLARKKKKLKAISVEDWKMASKPAFGKKETVKATNKRLRNEKFSEDTSCCYSGGLYKKVLSGWMD